MKTMQDMISEMDRERRQAFWNFFSGLFIGILIGLGGNALNTFALGQHVSRLYVLYALTIGLLLLITISMQLIKYAAWNSAKQYILSREHNTEK